jgi:hypothetical protein
MAFFFPSLTISCRENYAAGHKAITATAVDLGTNLDNVEYYHVEYQYATYY